jgi:hypothetical protein
MRQRKSILQIIDEAKTKNDEAEDPAKVSRRTSSSRNSIKERRTSLFMKKLTTSKALSPKGVDITDHSSFDAAVLSTLLPTLVSPKSPKSGSKNIQAVKAPSPPKNNRTVGKALWKAVRKQFDVNLVMKTPPQMRGEDEINFLIKFLKSLPAFSGTGDDEFTEDMLYDLALDVISCDYKPGEAVFYESDPSDAFYIILSGEANIVKHVLKPAALQAGINRRKSVHNIAANFKRASMATLFTMEIINTKGPGSTFGQIGLMKVSCIHTMLSYLMMYVFDIMHILVLHTCVYI